MVFCNSWSTFATLTRLGHGKASADILDQEVNPELLSSVSFGGLSQRSRLTEVN
jgi:hypothetical protein